MYTAVLQKCDCDKKASAAYRNSLSDEKKHGTYLKDNRTNAIVQRKESVLQNKVIQLGIDTTKKRKRKTATTKRRKVRKKRNPWELKSNQYSVSGKKKNHLRTQGPKLGSKVDFLTSSKFKKERMLRRAMMKKGIPAKGRNIHVLRQIINGKKVSFVSLSVPPGKDTSIKPGHSEFYTKKMSRLYMKRKKAKKSKNVYDATTRENCEQCRYKHKSDDPKTTNFGFEYPGSEDFMRKKDHKHVHDHQGKFPKIKGKLSKKEKEYRSDVKKKAKESRAFHNYLMSQKLNKLHKSKPDEDGHSSDDDDMMLGPGLGGVKDELKQTYKNVKNFDFEED